MWNLFLSDFQTLCKILLTNTIKQDICQIQCNTFNMRIQICVSSLNQSLKRRAELLLRRGVVLYEELREQSTEMWICVVCVGERRNVKIALQPWLPRPSFLTEPQAVTKKCKKRKPRLLLPPMHSGQKYHFFNLVSYDQCAFLVRIIFFRSFYCTQFSAYQLVRAPFCAHHLERIF